MEIEVLDKLYLEISQFTKARNQRENLLLEKIWDIKSELASLEESCDFSKEVSFYLRRICEDIDCLVKYNCFENKELTIFNSKTLIGKFLKREKGNKA